LELPKKLKGEEGASPSRKNLKGKNVQSLQERSTVGRGVARGGKGRERKWVEVRTREDWGGDKWPLFRRGRNCGKGKREIIKKFDETL